jgi:hypothetical protein
MLWKLNFITIWVWIWVQSFEQKIKNKIHLRKRSLIDQEWHLALKVLASEMAHAEREGGNTPAIQQQGKTWATKAQQDIPFNVAMKS